MKTGTTGPQPIKLPKSLMVDLRDVAERYKCTPDEIALMRQLAADHVVAARTCFHHLARE